jgi:hypothetical protein
MITADFWILAILARNVHIVAFAEQQTGAVLSFYRIRLSTLEATLSAPSKQ